jgi:hypothetical protein
MLTGQNYSTKLEFATHSSRGHRDPLVKHGFDNLSICIVLWFTECNQESGCSEDHERGTNPRTARNVEPL